MTSEFTESFQSKIPGFDFVKAHFDCEGNLYSEANPDGYVNFGSAQNFLQSDSRFNALQKLDVDLQDARYQPFAGTEACRTVVAEYLGQATATATATGAGAGAGAGATDYVLVDPQHVILGNGVISLLEALTIALLDEQDHVLIPTPVFPGLVNAMSLRVRSGVHLLHTKPEKDFRLTPSQLEAELQRCSSVKRIKAILLCSPGNPIGQVFSEQEMQQFLAIAERFDCALIVDEVYAGSCFSGVSFFSAIGLQSDRVYVLGGLSKDFGLAGFATGWLHIANDAVRNAVAKQSHFYRLPAPILRMTEALLDSEFRNGYLHRHQKALTTCFQTVVPYLDRAGIATTSTESGLCLWLDLREYLQTMDADGETRLYQSLLNEYRVHISPGTGFHTPNIGFFRICISQDEATLQEGLTRLTAGLSALRPTADSEVFA